MSDYEGMYDRLFERYTELQAELDSVTSSRDAHRKIRKTHKQSIDKKNKRIKAQSAEIARLKDKYAVLDKQYHNMFEIKEKDNK
jgi:predicted translin family RNA/ssDNA-binding protein